MWASNHCACSLGRAFVPPERYYASLPKSITGAGVVLHDESSRILLVKPAYRDDTWEIPGGGLEDGEDPWQAARREIAEELGLDVTPGRLLVVDWMPAQGPRPALANYLFDGSAISSVRAEEETRLQSDELDQWRFTGPDNWNQFLTAHMADRIRACAHALHSSSTAYLHHGQQPRPGLPCGHRDLWSSVDLISS